MASARTGVLSRSKLGTPDSARIFFSRRGPPSPCMRSPGRRVRSSRGTVALAQTVRRTSRHPSTETWPVAHPGRYGRLQARPRTKQPHPRATLDGTVPTAPTSPLPRPATPPRPHSPGAGMTSAGPLSAGPAAVPMRRHPGRTSGDPAGDQVDGRALPSLPNEGEAPTDRP